MSRLAALSLSMVLLLAAFPLISIGTTQDQPLWWWLGLLSLLLGGVIPPLGRLAARRPAPPASRAGMPEDCRVS